MGGSSTSVISISSSSHGIRAGCWVGISFVGMGAFSATGCAVLLLVAGWLQYNPVGCQLGHFSQL
eukprot:13158886-Ditylum_brightwellii.AAC.1